MELQDICQQQVEGVANRKTAGVKAPALAMPATAAKRPSAAQLKAEPRPTACMGCGCNILPGMAFTKCDQPKCAVGACVRCCPTNEGYFWCQEHKDMCTKLVGRNGSEELVITAAVPPRPVPDLPEGAAAGLGLLYQAVAVILASVPAGSEGGMHTAWRQYEVFARHFGISEPSSWSVCAYILLRVRPPVGVPLPEDFAIAVQPRTIRTYISAIRRRLRLTENREWLEAFCHEDVTLMMAAIGANVKRTKTDKKPILMKHIREIWDKATKEQLGTLVFIRDITLMLIGLLAGLRRREICGLRPIDVVWDETNQDLTISVRKDKTNQSIVDAQEPRTVTVGHELLSVVWPIYIEARKGITVDNPWLFPAMSGTRVTPLGVTPSAVSTLIKHRLPNMGVSPHSLRVGMATELFAQDVPVPLIQEIGRWSSLAALLYVLPSAEAMANATRKMGATSVVDRVVLQKDLSTDAAKWRVWNRALRAVPATA